jgi:hypothetical protein
VSLPPEPEAEAVKEPATSLVAENLVAGDNGDKNPATSLDIVADSDEDVISQVFQPSGSQIKFRKRWIEFDCQKGVHHGKYATYENGKRTRVKGGYLGRFNLVQSDGQYATRRVEEFIQKHDCHYPERFYKDMVECGISRIAVEGWASGRSLSGLSGSQGASGSQRTDLHRT